MKEEDENGSSSLVKESGRISTCCQRICLWSLKALECLGFRAKSKEAYVVPSLHLHDLQNKRSNVGVTCYWGLACENCSSGKAITVTYYVCVTVFLSTFVGIQNARVVSVIVCGLSRCTILPYIMS